MLKIRPLFCLRLVKAFPINVFITVLFVSLVHLIFWGGFCHAGLFIAALRRSNSESCGTMPPVSTWEG